MYILGINGEPGIHYHEGSAAVLKDGKVIAAAEQERFSRRKHAYGEAPIDAIAFCLEKANITLDNIDFIANGWADSNMPEILKGGIDTEYSLVEFPRSVFSYDKIPPIYFIKHHIAHIASAFYQSGFNEAACLVIDGQGESESITLAKVSQDKLEILKKYLVCYSLGAFYDASAKYCGLGYDVPGKLMGLAPYGIANQKMPISFDSKTGKFDLKISAIEEGKTGFIEVREKYIEYFIENNFPFKMAPFITCETGELMSYINFAASAQRQLEVVTLDILKYLKAQFNSDNLVIAGGVALNCTSNGEIDRSGLFKNIFIHPGSNDAGCSIGAALEVFRMKGIFKNIVPERLKNVYCGKEYTDSEIDILLNNIFYKKELLSEENFDLRVAEMLKDGKVLAWFQNGFEFGPRALGARSIIASPCQRSMLSNINRIKGRELWRPLSPIILDKFYQDVFVDENPDNMAHFMLKTCEIRDEWTAKIPAVVHIDKTSRPQIIFKDQNPLLYKVVEQFYTMTGVPVIINTSFNIKGQPIINSPKEALSAIESEAGLDGLIIGKWYITK